LLSGQATASYKFTDKLLSYLTYSRGAKSGGWNVNSIASPASLAGIKAITIRPEIADNVEVGFKSAWLDNCFYANVNYFMTKVQDYQASTNTVLDGRYVGILTNVGNVTSQGVEFDFKAVPIPKLEIGLTGAYTDARFDSGSAPTPFETIGTPVGAATRLWKRDH
jgi:iron complex outermembrane receptor protein